MRVDHTYAVTGQELYDVLVDPVFLKARAERYGGVGTPTVDVTDVVEVRTVRQLPLEHVPSAFRRFVGDGRVVQVDVWTPPADDADIAGRWSLDTGRAPITLAGTHLVAAVAAGCRYTVTADIHVSVPIVGAKLTRQVETYLAQLVTSEQRFAADWLEKQ